MPQQRNTMLSQGGQQRERMRSQSCSKIHFDLDGEKAAELVCSMAVWPHLSNSCCTSLDTRDALQASSKHAPAPAGCVHHGGNAHVLSFPPSLSLSHTYTHAQAYTHKHASRSSPIPSR